MGKTPIHFLVHSCPVCGWSGQEEQAEPVSPEIRRFVREKITPTLGKGEITPWRKWENFALIREAGGSNGFELGSDYLIAAQCARLGGRVDEEKTYRFKSIAHYRKALEEGDVPENSLYQVTYLVGELYRRVGDNWKSDDWFQKVLDMDLDHERREFFVSLARQQMTEPRNFIDEEHEKDSLKKKPGLMSKLQMLLGVGEERY